MVSLKDRLKAKLGRKNAPVPPHVEATATPHQAAPAATAVSPSNLPERLWDEAYSQTRVSDSDIVDAFEKILSARLTEHNAGGLEPPAESADNVLQQNEIAHDVGKRRLQMQQLVQHGLRKTEKDAAAKQGIGDGIQAAMVVKEVVDKAIQASPEAAVAWVGVCFALEILMNPLTEASSNRQGIAYVVSRMDWYWNLSSLLLDEYMEEAHSQGPRRELERVVTQLYSKLLLYQMKSVCYYHRRRFATWMRDLIKLENWDGELSDIQAAEAAVQEDSTQYNTATIRARLGVIAETAKSQNAKLGSVESAIREQTRQQERLHRTSADDKCIEHLRLTDPHDDKERIQDTKGGLLRDSYRWVLDNVHYQQWCSSPQNQLLWIKADPGKGKTMLLCGIIDELRGSLPETALLSYFFCQATDSRINSATAVLRGLLIIDALDECATDRTKLLEFVAQQSSTSDRVKWIVSSRNWPEIEAQLKRAGHKVKLSLELNAMSVSAAVDVFIHRKVDQLAQTKEYDEQLRHAVLQQLTSKADNTFLWVALVCQELERIENWDVREKLALFPSGLNSLYERMMDQISGSNSAEICLQVLASTAVLYRPVTIPELIVLTEQLARFVGDLESVRKIVSLCGSFLTLREDTIYFVHQSAKDFLFATAVNKTFPTGTEDIHRVIFSKSLAVLSRTLHRDMYGLKEPGIPIENAKPADLDPLAASGYSCIYWIDHLYDSKPASWANSSSGLQVAGVINEFLRKKYLYWLEGLSLCKSIAKGVVLMAKLRHLVEIWNADELQQHVQDAQRFIMYHKGAIESYPLQVYVSALLFSPTKSLIRRLFRHEEPKGISIKPSMSDSWSACLQTLEGHSGGVTSVAFSHDSAQLASASGDKTVKIWDASSGACLHTLEGHSSWVTSVAFSHDSAQLASASFDNTVKIWDASSGACLHTLEGHSSWVTSVAFSHDSAQLASASGDKTVKIWDASSGVCLHTLEGHSSEVSSVAFSHDSTQLASASSDNTVKIWDASSGVCLHTLEGHSNSVRSVAFSHDSAQLASASGDKTVKIWDASSGACLHTLEGHSSDVSSVAFSHDSARLASASYDNTVKIWDASSGACLQTLEGHSHYVDSVAFSHDSARLASASYDNTVKIWDASSGACLHTLEGHSHYVDSVAFSHDSARLASASDDNTVKIWDASSGACLHTLEGHSSEVSSVAFSHDSMRLASASSDNTVKIWDASSGVCLHTLEGHSSWVTSVAFSHDSARLASASGDKTVKIWDASSGVCLHTLEGHSSEVSSVAFSHDSTRLASASYDNTVKIWDASSGACLQTLNIGKALSNLSFDSAGSYLYTEIGTIVVQKSQVGISDVAEPKRPRHLGIGVSSDSMWIQHAGKSMLWVPSEYRPSCSAVCGTNVGIGVGSGRVWMCSIDL